MNSEKKIGRKRRKKRLSYARGQLVIVGYFIMLKYKTHAEEKKMTQKRDKKTLSQPIAVDYNRPYVEQEVLLYSFTTQSVYEKTYDAMEKNLFALSVIVRTVGKEDSAEAVNALVTEMMDELADELHTEIARLDVLIDGNEIQQQVNYTDPKKVVAKISSPQAGRYLSLLRDVDKVVSRLTLLWVTGLVSEAEYTKQCKRWFGRFRRLAVRLRYRTRSAVRFASQQRAQAVAAANKKAAEKEKNREERKKAKAESEDKVA